MIHDLIAHNNRDCDDDDNSKDDANNVIQQRQSENPLDAVCHRDNNQPKE